MTCPDMDDSPAGQVGRRVPADAKVLELGSRRPGWEATLVGRSEEGERMSNWPGVKERASSSGLLGLEARRGQVGTPTEALDALGGKAKPPYGVHRLAAVGRGQIPCPPAVF